MLQQALNGELLFSHGCSSFISTQQSLPGEEEHSEGTICLVLRHLDPNPELQKASQELSWLYKGRIVPTPTCFFETHLGGWQEWKKRAGPRLRTQMTEGRASKIPEWKRDFSVSSPVDKLPS